MYRRRRIQREKIAFGFDSFLDLVANVIGIIVRLILVAWVGARFYTSALQKRLEAPQREEAAVIAKAEPLPAPGEPPAPNPLVDKIAQARRDLDEARRELAARLDGHGQLESRHAKSKEAIDKMRRLHAEYESRRAAADKSLHAWRFKTDNAAISLDLFRKRSSELLAEIKAIEKSPAAKKPLRFHAPVSRVVDGEEMMFECRAGRVSYVDVPAFLHDMKAAIEERKVDEIIKRGSLSGTTAVIGSFRVRYNFEAEADIFGPPGRYRIQLSKWVVEPATPIRGENEESALTAASDFRRLVDRLDPSHTTVTFWVYPDSFALFRSLRDYLYAQGVEVAGRPLPDDVPIAASSKGTRSRGQ